MTTREIHGTPGIAATFFTALGTGGKRPGLVDKLLPTTLVRPAVTLDAAHIAQYQSICGFAASQGVPLIYPQLLSFPLMMAYITSDACPWPALGTVHLGNVVEQTRALRAGETVRVELHTGELFTHDKGQGFHMDVHILQGGIRVWRARQSLLRVGVPDKSGTAYDSQVQGDAPLSRQAEFSAPADIGRRYAPVSGDRNPIHLTALSAKLFGFRRAIAHGMWTQARALSCLLPATPLEQARLAVDFKTPLYLPGRASLWTAHQDHGVLFEVRDGQGVKPHLRGYLTT